MQKQTTGCAAAISKMGTRKMGRQSLYGTMIVFHFPDIGDKQPRLV